MGTHNRIVRIFMMPQQFPCGPAASCCGPIGQSEEEIDRLKEAIEKNLNRSVEVKNITQKKEMQEYTQILSLVYSFGPMALPIIALDGEVVCMGNPTPEQAIEVLREKIAQIES